jgi:hypothetical protein
MHDISPRYIQDKISPVSKLTPMNGVRRTPLTWRAEDDWCYRSRAHQGSPTSSRTPTGSRTSVSADRPNQAGDYLVPQRGELVAIHNGVYFRSTNEVDADFQELIQAGLEGVWSDDYVIRCDGRIVAGIHQPIDGHEQKLFLFNEPRNDPIAGREIAPMPNWPTYEECVAGGRAEL